MRLSVRVGSALLVLVFLLSMGGYHGIYWSLRRQARAEMHEQLQRHAEPEGHWYSQTELAGAQWVEKNEIRFRNQMYDIKERKWENGRYYYYCVADEKEQRLNETYARLQQMADDGNSSMPGPLKTWIKKSKDQETATYSLHTAPQPADDNPRRSSSSQFLYSCYLPVYSPPPEA